MKRTFLFGLVLAFTLLAPQTTFAATSTEAVTDVFNKAMDKWITNSSGRMYATDNALTFMNTKRYEVNADLFLFTKIAKGTSSVSTSSVEFYLQSNVFRQVKDVSKGVLYENSILNMKSYVNGVQIPKLVYSDTTTKFVNGTISELYKSTTDSLNQTDPVDLIAQKLKTRGVPKTIRDKVFKKLTTAGYIKLNTQEALQGMYASLGLEEEKDISSFNLSKSKSDITYFLNNIIKIKGDKGIKNVTHTPYLNVYNGNSVSQEVPVRVITLSLDIDQLAQKAIAEKSVSTISFGFAKDTDSLESIKKTLHGLYDDLLIEVWVNTLNYDLEKVYIPEYLITNTLSDRQTGFSFFFEMTKADTSGAVKIPKKFLTPKQVRSEYAKY